MHALFLGEFRSPAARQFAVIVTIAFVGALSIPALSLAQPTQPAPAKKEPPLPPSAELPGERSELLDKQYDKPLITLQEFNDFRPNVQRYVQALRAGEFTGPAKTLIEEGIRIHVLSLSLPEKREEIDQLRKKLARDLNNHTGSGDPNVRRQRTFRSTVFDLVIKHCQELMDNNLFVRLQAVALLNELELTRADRRNKIPAEPYANVLPALRAIVVDPKQDTAVKIVAVRGIQRLASSTMLSISRTDLLATSEELVAELKRKPGGSENGQGVFFAYPQIVMDALRAIKIDVDRPGQPFIVQALAEIMADKSADPRVRSHAAFTIVRVPLVPKVKLSVISYQVASLTEELTAEFNASPQKFYWPECFFKLYAAYQSLNDEEAANNIGLLKQSKQAAFSTEPDAAGATVNITGTIVEAYNTVFPVVKFVLENERGNNEIPNGTSAPLGEWLKKNSPKPHSIAPGLPELKALSSVVK
ncbi:MAG TPA: hypothetical protein VLA12_21320 [Planctomycetaceae bacterium]|nr:hypothetical protein [Planctomycetaceae bacterium]